MHIVITGIWDSRAYRSLYVSHRGPFLCFSLKDTDSPCRLRRWADRTRWGSSSLQVPLLFGGRGMARHGAAWRGSKQLSRKSSVNSRLLSLSRSVSGTCQISRDPAWFCTNRPLKINRPIVLSGQIFPGTFSHRIHFWGSHLASSKATKPSKHCRLSPDDVVGS